MGDREIRFMKRVRNGFRILRIAGFCGLGVVTGRLGYPLDTWPFWVIMGLAGLIQFSTEMESWARQGRL